jgi:hypothetical protein
MHPVHINEVSAVCPREDGIGNLIGPIDDIDAGLTQRLYLALGTSFAA